MALNNTLSPKCKNADQYLSSLSQSKSPFIKIIFRRGGILEKRVLCINVKVLKIFYWPPFSYKCNHNTSHDKPVQLSHIKTTFHLNNCSTACLPCLWMFPIYTENIDTQIIYSGTMARVCHEVKHSKCLCIWHSFSWYLLQQITKKKKNLATRRFAPFRKYQFDI